MFVVKYIMNKPLNKKQAVEFLGLDDKTFDNFFKNAGEFKSLPRDNDKGRFYFDEDVLTAWIKSFNWRTVELDLSDYIQCLDFALAQHFRGYVISDWGTGRQREFGQKVTNWVKGQLGEVAVKKFIKREFNVDIELDFEIRDDIVPQDVVGIYKDGKIVEPQIGIGIKSSKPKSSYLVLGEKEITLDNRKSDFYIFCRPDLPDDHLLRLTKDMVMSSVKGQEHFASYKDKVPSFENIKCEIAGWCSISELEKVNSIPGQNFDGFRYVKKSGDLHKDFNSWKDLISKL